MALDYTKETALYQPDAIGNGISDARGKAERYITSVIDSGIFVHTEESPMPTVPETTGNNGVHISDDVDIIANGVNVASYGANARIGVETANHVLIGADGLRLYDASSLVGQLRAQNGSYALSLQDTYKFIAGLGNSTRNQLTIGCEGAQEDKKATVWIKANGEEGEADLYLCDDASSLPPGYVVAILPYGANVNGALNVSQDIKVNGHNGPIGYLERDSVEVDIDTPGVSNLVEGAFASVSPGSYYIVGECTFPGREGDPAYTNLEVQIYNQTANAVLGRQRIVVYRNAETHLQAATAVTTTAVSSDIYVRVAAGSECLGCTTKIRVMRIC